MQTRNEIEQSNPRLDRLKHNYNSELSLATVQFKISEKSNKKRTVMASFMVIGALAAAMMARSRKHARI